MLMNRAWLAGLAPMSRMGAWRMIQLPVPMSLVVMVPGVRRTLVMVLVRRARRTLRSGGRVPASSWSARRFRGVAWELGLRVGLPVAGFLERRCRGLVGLAAGGPGVWVLVVLGWDWSRSRMISPRRAPWRRLGWPASVGLSGSTWLARLQSVMCLTPLSLTAK